MSPIHRVRMYLSNPSTVLVSLRLVRFRLWTLRPTLAFIRPGDVVIDCGANVGLYTARFADRGATVHAFEPHPAAFAKLRERFAGNPRVVCHNKAVAVKPGTVTLYLHKQDAADPVLYSQGASTIAAKDNVDPSRGVAVEAVSLNDFIRSVGPVAVLKMDVEGAEYDLLTALIGEGLHERIGLIVVETHERINGFAVRHEALVKLLKNKGIKNINLGWL